MDENKWIELENKLIDRNLESINKKINVDKNIDYIELLTECGYDDPEIEEFLSEIEKYRTKHFLEINKEFEDISEEIINKFDDYMVNEIENYAIYDKKAIYLFGLPGSGKSTILEAIQKDENIDYILVDPDAYKRGVFHNGTLVFEPLQDPQLSGLDVEVIHKTSSILAKIFTKYLISLANKKTPLAIKLS
ncbi:MAG: zeta toxin family protein [Candidatus Izemoplasmatales bacterium]